MSPLTGLMQAGRAWHELIMEDECSITREGDRVLNEANGQYTVNESEVYSGRCRLVVQPRRPQDADTAGQLEAVTHARIDLPVIESAGVRDGDVVTFTKSADPALVGVKYRLRGLAGQTHATARRFFVEVYT